MKPQTAIEWSAETQKEIKPLEKWWEHESILPLRHCSSMNLSGSSNSGRPHGCLSYSNTSMVCMWKIHLSMYSISMVSINHLVGEPLKQNVHKKVSSGPFCQ